MQLLRKRVLKSILKQQTLMALFLVYKQASLILPYLELESLKNGQKQSITVILITNRDYKLLYPLTMTPLTVLKTSKEKQLQHDLVQQVQHLLKRISMTRK